ncbi:hypothetical protein RRG08_048128 [Elysia crispata]|uniref:Uncharacterized protein n=1 Tax=Elysia crispata TaxID=231223 RepID=A0AAE0ZK15_9GAST|nr:hypothetical protein RRG08_048128 [Elysia crispata]
MKLYSVSLCLSCIAVVRVGQAKPADQTVSSGDPLVAGMDVDPSFIPQDGRLADNQRSVSSQVMTERGEVDWGHAVTAGTVQQHEEEHDLQESGLRIQIPDVTEIRETIGVIDPETILHKGDNHHHNDEGVQSVHSESEGEPCTDCQNNLERIAESAKARTTAEENELNILRPNIRVNVHDPQARAIADSVRDQQFGPGDIETIVHGGQSVHVSYKQARVHTGQPEAWSHEQDEAVHGEDGHQKKVLSNEEIGPTFEKAVHGHEHVHDHTNSEAGSDDPSRKVIKYQDIVDLELSEQMLKGIDLSQLMEQERREAAEWRKLSGLSEEDDSFQAARDVLFVYLPGLPSRAVILLKSQSLRQQYLERLAARIKFIRPPDLDTAEWDDGSDDIPNGGQGLSSSLPHPGESRVEHEMELWGSTAPKGARIPYRQQHEHKGGGGI